MRKHFNILTVIFITVIITHTIDRFISVEHIKTKDVSLVSQQQVYDHLSLNSPQTSVVHAQFDFHIVSPGVWRSNQPNEESIIRMRKHGLKTIVNLRRSEPMHL